MATSMPFGYDQGYAQQPPPVAAAAYAGNAPVAAYSARDDGEDAFRFGLYLVGGGAVAIAVAVAWIALKNEKDHEELREASAAGDQRLLDLLNAHQYEAARAHGALYQEIGALAGVAGSRSLVEPRTAPLGPASFVPSHVSVASWPPTVMLSASGLPVVPSMTPQTVVPVTAGTSPYAMTFPPVSSEVVTTPATTKKLSKAVEAAVTKALAKSSTRPTLRVVK